MCGTRPGKGRAGLCRCTPADLHQAWIPGAAQRSALRLCRGDGEGGWCWQDSCQRLQEINQVPFLVLAPLPNSRWQRTLSSRLATADPSLGMTGFASVSGLGAGPTSWDSASRTAAWPPRRPPETCSPPTSMRASGRRRSAPACPVFQLGHPSLRPSPQNEPGVPGGPEAETRGCDSRSSCR